jgi:hypothetical protein
VGASLGGQILGGVDVPAGRVSVSPALSWNAAQRRFGRVDAEGDDARESLATFRLNVAYLIRY